MPTNSAVGGGAQCHSGRGPLDFVQKAGEPPLGLLSPTETGVGLSQEHWAGIGVGVGVGVPDGSHVVLQFVLLCLQPEFWKHGVPFNMSFSRPADLVQKIIPLIQPFSTCRSRPLLG